MLLLGNFNAVSYYNNNNRVCLSKEFSNIAFDIKKNFPPLSYCEKLLIQK